MIQTDNREPTLFQAFWILFVTFVLFLASALLSGYLLGKTGIVVVEILLVLPVFLFLRKHGLSIKTSCRMKAVSPVVMMLSAFIGLGIGILIDELNRLLQIVVPMDEELISNLLETMQWHSFPEGVILFLGAVLIASVSEELLFRGFFQNVMETYFSVTRAVIGTALVFALLHFQPWFVVEYVTMGVLLGVLSWRTGSVYPSMVMHGVVNSLALVFANSPASLISKYEMHGHVSPVWIILSIVMVYGCMKALYNRT
ncbi:CPBP family intramembrane metalloprotease [bacterium]|nr:CPBP family intramembrane metalloprotease [bacterium]